MSEPIKLEISGADGISKAIEAVASAISRRDDLISEGIASDNPKFVAWAESELELRQGGNDVLDALGKPFQLLAERISNA